MLVKRRNPNILLLFFFSALTNKTPDFSPIVSTWVGGSRIPNIDEMDTQYHRPEE